MASGWIRRDRSSIFRPLFDCDVEVADVDPRDVSLEELPLAERLHVATAAAERQREFAAGRLLARELLSLLGFPSHRPLLPGADRAPLWPDGVVGSITHCSDLACVALASRDQYRSLGCDVEGRSAVSLEVARKVVCTGAEWACLGSGPSRYVLAKLVFSAKESFFKMQHPLTRVFLGFDEAEVTLDTPGAGFRVRLLRDAGPLVAGQIFGGRFALNDRHIATAMALHR